MDSTTLVQSARESFNAGRFSDAEKFAREVLARDPQNVDAMHLLGAIAHRFGHHQIAVDLLSRAVQIAPNSADLHVNLGLAWRGLGRGDQALAAFVRAVNLDSKHAHAMTMLALSLGEIGDYANALQAWQRVCELQPDNAQSRSNLGTVLERLGKLNESLEMHRQALAIDPKYFPAMNNLASVLALLARYDEAIAAHHETVKMAPDYVPAYVSMAFTFQQVGKLREATDAARKACELAPDLPGAHRNLATVLQEIGKIEEARAEYQKAIELFDRSSAEDRETAKRLKLATAILLPQVYDSIEHVRESRAQLVENLEKLERQGFKIELKNEPVPTLFDLAYQGMNDREIVGKFASLIKIDDRPSVKRHTTKIRIGFISRFLKSHTIGQLNIGIIEHLSREKFEVLVFSVGDFRDEISARLRKSADRFIILPVTLEESRRLIAETQLDVLFYTDLGMDPVTYSLAFSRLAPLQMTTWGHPMTTGIPSVDWFLSSELLEVPGSEDQYTERLAKLKNLAVYYERPRLNNNPKRRGDFDLPEDATLYGCLQMIWKFHPEFDELIAQVLRQDRQGRLVLVQSLNRHLDELLLARWRRVMADVVERVIFVPRQSREDFLALTACCDVMLDPMHFCGGNTSYEALAFGVPIVTLPSQMLRGRLTSAMYRMMGLEEMIAVSKNDYVEKAVKLGTNREFRHATREQILARNHVLYENKDAVRELEEFLIAVARA